MKKQHLSIVLAILYYVSSAFATQKVENFNTKQPSVFYPNKGQIIDQNRKVRKDVRYHYSAPGFALSITDKGMSWTVTKTERFEKKSKELEGSKLPSHGGARGGSENDSLVFHTHRVDVEFVVANMMIPIEEAQVQDYYQNFYTEYTGEQGITNLHGAKQITLKNVWNGIDMVFQAKEEGKLEYDFILHPNANIKDIQLKYNGQNGLQLLQNELKIMTAQGEVRETIPMSYEKENSKAITVGYQVTNNIVSFVTKSEYNKQNTLVIDPQLVWGTYFDGGNNEYCSDIATEGVDNIFVTGYTNSTTGIATNGANRTTQNGFTDAYLAKFSSDGKRVWSTYYGGESNNMAYGIVYSKTSKNIYTTGSTNSTSGIATTGVYQTFLYGAGFGYRDAFIYQFDDKGQRNWATYFGGNLDDDGLDISIDKSDNVYVTGRTGSTTNITSSGAYSTKFGGTGLDGFLGKFDKNGNRIWSTYFGGEQMDECFGTATDNNGSVYIAGRTSSSKGIATSGAYLTTASGSSWNVVAFLAKFKSNGNIDWATYYGGDGASSRDEGYSVAIDKDNNAIMTGLVSSTKDIASSGAHQTSFGGSGYDGFIVKFSHAGKRKWATYYGGDYDDLVKDVKTDNNKNIYLFGESRSSSNIATSSSYQTSNNGGEDFFIAILDSSGKRVSASYYGGPDTEFLQQFSGRMDLDEMNHIYICGITFSDTLLATKGKNIHQSKKTSYQSSIIAKFKTQFTQKCATPIADAGEDKLICGSGQVQIGSSPKANHFYRWQAIPASSGISDTIANPKVEPKILTLYILKDSVSGGCFSYDSVWVTVGSRPVVKLGNDTTVLSGTQLNFGVAPIKGYKYKWNTGDTVSQINPTINSNKFFKLIVTNEVGCSDSDEINISVSTGIERNSIMSYSNIQLYPNPSDNSMLTIQGVNQSANLRITDMNGKTLFQQPLQPSERQTVNANLPQGVYLVEIQLPNQVVMKKWMVR